MSENNPTISVLMSVYREPLDWVKESIDSITGQTFKDFEFIIINDNPTDERLSRFLYGEADKDSRIRLIFNRENIGLTKSLNKGLERCRGEYIARMDADDVSIPTRFERQVKYLDKNPECGIVGCNIMLFGTRKGTAKFPVSSENLIAQQYFTSPFDHPATMMRRSTINSCNIRYDEKLRYAQDQKLWYDLSKVCKFGSIPEILFCHRYNKQQITKLHGGKQLHTIKSVRKMMIEEFLSSHGITVTDISNISINDISEIDHKIKLTISHHSEKKILTKVIITLCLSLKSYNIHTFTRFIMSGLYLRNGWSVKDTLRFFIRHFNHNAFEGAGIYEP